MAPSAFKPLTITPVAFSLTDGTNIPAPPDSPPATPVDAETNGVGGGPLSSHPAPTEHGAKPGAFPPSPSTDAEKRNEEDTLGQLPNLSQNNVLSPATSPNGDRKRPSSVRRLLSLRSIRSEKDRHSQYGTPGSPRSSHGKQSTDSTGLDASTRPGSPYTISTMVSSGSSKPSLGRKRSSAWFGGGRRKSGFFPIKFDEEGALLEGGAVKAPSGPPPPTIPEFRSLAEALDGGDLGAEDMFKDIK